MSLPTQIGIHVLACLSVVSKVEYDGHYYEQAENDNLQAQRGDDQDPSKSLLVLVLLGLQLGAKALNRKAEDIGQYENQRQKVDPDDREIPRVEKSNDPCKDHVYSRGEKGGSN